MKSNPWVQWFLFGLFLLLALCTPYILIFLFTVVVEFNPPLHVKNILVRCKYHMYLPLSFLLSGLFVYLAVIVSLGSLWNQRFEGVILVNIIYKLFVTLFIFYFVLAGVFGIWRASKLVLDAVNILMRIRNSKPFYRPVVLEFVKILGIAVTALTGLFLLVLALQTNPFRVQGDVDPSINFLGSLNLLTLLIVIGITPLLRDIIAGFTMLIDSLLQPNGLICLLDVTRKGYIVSFGLRLTTLRMLDDSILHIPNNKFLRYAMVDYSSTENIELLIFVKMDPSVSSQAIRRFTIDLRTRFVAECQAMQSFVDTGDAPTNHWAELIASPSTILVALSKYHELALSFTLHNSDESTLKRFQSEVLLLTSATAEEHENIFIEGTTRISYRSISSEQKSVRTYTE